MYFIVLVKIIEMGKGSMSVIHIWQELKHGKLKRPAQNPLNRPIVLQSS